MASLWSVADRANPVRLAALAGSMYVGQPVFSPDGKTLVLSGGWDWEPYVFDVTDPTRPALLSTVPEAFTGWLTYSPDGKTLAVSSPDSVWSLWDLTDRAKPVLLSKQDGWRAPVAFSPDGRSVLTAGAPGIVWDVTNPTRPAKVGTLDGDWSGVSVSPTRPLVATSDSTGALSFWHLDNPAKPRKFVTKAVRGYHATFSDDGLTLATSDREGTARLWDMTDNAPVHLADLDDHGGSAQDLSFSRDGRTLASTGSVGLLSLWNVAAHGQPALRGEARANAFEKGVAAALTPDGQRLVTVQSAGTATVWDVPAMVERVTVPVSPSRFVDRAAISPAGDLVAVSSLIDRVLTLTDLNNPGTPLSLPADASYVRGLAFSPDGNTLAVSGGFDVQMWDLTDRQNPVRLPDLMASDLTAVIRFSPDGRTVAVAEGRKVLLFNVADRWDPVQFGTLRGHADEVLALAFSPDSRLVATGSTDKTAALWEITGTPGRRAILTGNGGVAWTVAFAPDGRTLAVGTGDEAAAMWDVTEASGPVRVMTLKRTVLKTAGLVFHPDGRSLVSMGSSYGYARAALWDYSSLTALRADPAAVACGVAGGGLTPEEWAAAIPESPYQRTCAH
jgi:WD40 repeat protein